MSQCDQAVVGRLSRYCPQLITRSEGAVCHSTEQKGEVCYAWDEACKKSGGRLEYPTINIGNMKLNTKEAVDFMLADKKILIIEDNKVSQKVLIKTLSPFSDDSMTAVNGEVALQMVQENTNIGLVLLDLEMPVMDGMEFLKSLNDLVSDHQSRFPIIVVSEFKKWKTAKEAIELGVLGYVKKPYTNEQMLEKVKESLIMYHENLNL